MAKKERKEIEKAPVEVLAAIAAAVDRVVKASGTQAKAAVKLGIAQGQISTYTGMKTQPRIPFLIRLRNAAGVPLDELLRLPPLDGELAKRIDAIIAERLTKHSPKMIGGVPGERAPSLAIVSDRINDRLRVVLERRPEIGDVVRGRLLKYAAGEGADHSEQEWDEIVSEYVRGAEGEPTPSRPTPAPEGNDPEWEARRAAAKKKARPKKS